MQRPSVNNTAAVDAAHKGAMEYIQEKYGSDIVTEEQVKEAEQAVRDVVVSWIHAGQALKDAGIRRFPNINRSRTNSAAKAVIDEFDRVDAIYQPLLAKRTAIYEKGNAQRKDYDAKLNELMPPVTTYYKAFKELEKGRTPGPFLPMRTGGPPVPPRNSEVEGGRRRRSRTRTRKSNRRIKRRSRTSRR
jgi:hypothetical protein